MSYQPRKGDAADATHPSQVNAALAGNYLVEPAPSVSIGNSSTSIETIVSAGVVRMGNEFVELDQQTLTHPDGPDENTDPNPDPEEGPDPDAPVARVDLITANENGDANRIVGQPYKVDPLDRTYPRTRKPVPEEPPLDQAVIAAVWVPEGVDNAEAMFDDWVVPREVLGTALNQLDLIPGRDLQYILDNAREGETLRGDRSQVITLAQPLTLRVPNVTIEGLNLRYAPGAATSTADDMLTIATDGATVRGVTLDGNKQNQPAVADGITVKADARNNTIEDVDATDMGGYAVNVNGGYNNSLAVTDTDVSRIQATRPGGAAVVVQGRAYRTSLRNIKCDAPASGGGAILVRNGPVGTTVDTAYCRSGDYVLKVADFGAENDDTAPVQGLKAETLTADGTPAILANGVSPGVGHREVRVQNARLRNPPADGGIVINLDNINSATVDDSSLVGFSGGSAIHGINANSLRVTGVTIRAGDPNESGIFIRDANGVKVLDSVVRNDDGGEAFAVGINVLARDADVQRVKILNNDVYTVGGPDYSIAGIQLNESGGQIERSHVKNNAATVVNDSTNESVRVEDNV